MKWNIFTVFLATLVVFSTSGNEAQAKTCKDWAFIGQAIGNTKAGTKSKARTDWKTKVSNHWGFQWSSWSLAKMKWQFCERKGKRYSCLAQGTPCSLDEGVKIKPKSGKLILRQFLWQKKDRKMKIRGRRKSTQRQDLRAKKGRKKNRR